MLVRTPIRNWIMAAVAGVYNGALHINRPCVWQIHRSGVLLPSPLGGEGRGFGGKTPHPQPLSPKGRGEEE